jgi:hypothetical protein
MSALPPQIVIKHFDPFSINLNPVIVIIGQNSSGTTTLAGDMINHMTPAPVRGYAACSNYCEAEYYKTRFPYVSTYEGYDNSILKEIVEIQDPSVHSDCFLVIDKCHWDNSWQRDHRMRNLFINSRIFHTAVIITLGYPMGVIPILRACVNYVFVSRENIISNRRRLYEQWGSIFPTFELFCAAMNVLRDREDYTFLVFDNTSTSKNIEDRVFYYKATCDEKIMRNIIWNRPLSSSTPAQ